MALFIRKKVIFLFFLGLLSTNNIFARSCYNYYNDVKVYKAKTILQSKIKRTGFSILGLSSGVLSTILTLGIGTPVLLYAGGASVGIVGTEIFYNNVNTSNILEKAIYDEKINNLLKSAKLIEQNKFNKIENINQFAKTYFPNENIKKVAQSLLKLNDSSQLCEISKINFEKNNVISFKYNEIEHINSKLKNLIKP